MSSDGFRRGAAADIGPQIEWMLQSGRQVTLQISGDSMRPTLKPRRDAAILEPLDTWPPERGDILFFKSERSPSGYALHRVVRVEGDGAYVNGDAQNWTEGPILQAAALAHAVALVRKGKLMDVKKPLYRAYVALWRYTRPVRKPLFAIWRKFKSLLGRE